MILEMSLDGIAVDGAVVALGERALKYLLLQVATLGTVNYFVPFWRTYVASLQDDLNCAFLSCLNYIEACSAVSS